MSAACGRVVEAALYRAQAAKVADALNAKFLDAASGAYGLAGAWNATQCAQSMPLYLQIVPPDVRARVVGVLVDALARSDGHLQVGAFGVKYLLQALVDGGRADLAWGVMNKTTFPGFGFMLNASENGLTNATSFWEGWAASDDVYSNNHPLLAGSETYLFNGLAGIQLHPEASAWSRVIFKPAPPPRAHGLDAVAASIESPRGLISSAWTVDAQTGEFVLRVCVPPGVRAEVWLPGSGRRVDAGTCCGCVFRDRV